MLCQQRRDVISTTSWCVLTYCATCRNLFSLGLWSAQWWGCAFDVVGRCCHFGLMQSVGFLDATTLLFIRVLCCDGSRPVAVRVASSDVGGRVFGWCESRLRMSEDVSCGEVSRDRLACKSRPSMPKVATADNDTLLSILLYPMTISFLPYCG